jgi:hypothetical protein
MITALNHLYFCSEGFCQLPLFFFLLVFSTVKHSYCHTNFNAKEKILLKRQSYSELRNPFININDHDKEMIRSNAVGLVQNEFLALKEFYFSLNGMNWHWTESSGEVAWNITTIDDSLATTGDPCSDRWQGKYRI